MVKRGSIGAALRRHGGQASLVSDKPFIGSGEPSRGEPDVGNMPPLLRQLLRRSGAVARPAARRRRGNQS